MNIIVLYKTVTLDWERSKIPNINSLNIILKSILSNQVILIDIITDEIIEEIKRRIISVVKTMNLLSEGKEKYIISKGKRYWNIKVDDYYKHSKGKIEIHTGHILSSSGTKPLGNILHSLYSGIEYIFIYDNKAVISNLNLKRLDTNLKPNSKFFIKLTTDRVYKIFTENELKIKNKDQLIDIYRNIKTGYSGKNKKQLIDGILN